MNYGEIKCPDIANGEGVRVTLFVSGCTHRCKGCFNPETWSFSYGKPYTAEVEERLLSLLDQPFIAGLTLLGGEPMEPQNQAVLVNLLRRVKEKFPQKTVWCYTGYTLESDLLSHRLTDATLQDEMLSYIDVLVDGEFVLDLKRIDLQFRGSSNQRIIDLQKTLQTGKTVLWEKQIKGK
jgi:anaerobic ribonucleoside-triphosphate reductase activating protein